MPQAAVAAIPIATALIGAGTAAYSASEQRAAQERSIKAQKDMYARNQPPPMLTQPPPLPASATAAGQDSLNAPGTNISPILQGNRPDVKESSATGGLQVDPNQQKKLFGSGMSIGV